jgi:20S proteasome subunit beta 4
MSECTIRSQLAHFLRKSPYNVNLMIAGYEDGKGPSLYYMDYLASLHELPRCAHGYAAHFTLGLLDRFYKRDLTEAEGIHIIRQCISELETRFLINRSGFVIKIVDKVCAHLLDHPCHVEWSQNHSDQSLAGSFVFEYIKGRPNMEVY